MRIIKGDKVPIYNWASFIESDAIDQLRKLSELDFVWHHIAAMPDVHKGYTLTIGGVLPTDGMISPDCVGKDIGCGMCAVLTNLTLKDLNIDTVQKIISLMYRMIPVGHNHHASNQSLEWMPKNPGPIAEREWDSARRQVGTLGGGNHFIEIQLDPQDRVFIMIHSGSRNVGLKIADFYDGLARQLRHSGRDDLAFLRTDTEEGRMYIHEMNWALDFAMKNRDHMINEVMAALRFYYPHAKEMKKINIHHNYAALETHFGKQVWVHRKGATLADTDTVGIIPGSIGQKSYIVTGRGNPDSFNSCSHGAGRAMGRKAAQRTLNLEAEIKRCEESGMWIFPLQEQKDLEEAPGSYKDIIQVMEDQKDLINIFNELRPLAGFKGTGRKSDDGD